MCEKLFKFWNDWQKNAHFICLHPQTCILIRQWFDQDLSHARPNIFQMQQQKQLEEFETTCAFGWKIFYFNLFLENIFFSVPLDVKSSSVLWKWGQSAVNYESHQVIWTDPSVKPELKLSSHCLSFIHLLLSYCTLSDAWGKWGFNDGKHYENK